MRRKLFSVLMMGLALYPAFAYSQSLDTPADGSHVSGIGYVRGWKCTGGNLTFTIDNGPSAPLSYGGDRGDTLGVCGHINTGFITQFNWNLLDNGQHTIRVFDNGQQFAQSTFTVTTMGSEYLTGQSGATTLTFAGQQVTLTWQQDQQNFVITAASGSGGGGSTCVTKTATAHWLDDTAAWTIVNSCTGNTLDITMQAVGGSFFACSSELDFVQNGKQYDDSTFSWKDFSTNQDFCDDILSGLTKTFRITVNGGVDLNFTQPFSIFYDDEKVVDFP